MGIDVHHPTPAADRRFLQEVIRTVSSTLDLDRVLQAIVDLLTEATQCHACYVFLANDRDHMVLSACSEPYAAHVGVIAMAPGEGLAGWVAAHREPVFITQDAASDPRDAGVRGVRGGEVPVGRVGAADREGLERARRRRPARRGAARLLAARRRVPPHQRVAGGRRDRERPAAPRDRAPRRDAGGAVRAGGRDLRGGDARGAAARGDRTRRAAARRHRLRDLPARGRTASACGCARHRRARPRRA